MARVFEPTAEQEAAWADWVSQRPENVRRVAERFAPWTLCRLKSTGQRVTLQSFSEEEDGTVTVTVVVGADFNMVFMERAVFGIDPDDLEECELPADQEAVGALLNNEQEVDFINARRAENGLPPLDQEA